MSKTRCFNGVQLVPRNSKVLLVLSPPLPRHRKKERMPAKSFVAVLVATTTLVNFKFRKAENRNWTVSQIELSRLIYINIVRKDL